MKQLSKTLHSSHAGASSKRNKIIAIAAALTVVIVGYALIMSQAAGPFVSIDSSSATLSGNASVVTASDGTKAISFNAPVVTPPPTTPPPTTPPPVSGLKGWQLTPTSVGLAPHGLSCASLPEYTGPTSQGYFKPAAGTVITGKRISKAMNLSNGNITIEKSCIKGNGIINAQGMVVTWDPDQCGESCTPGRGPVTIRDSEFDGSAIGTLEVARGCALHGLAFLERNYVHDLGSGLCMVNTGDQFSGSMISNYVHKLRGDGRDPGGPGSHNETATIRDFPTAKNPSRTMPIYNNYFDSSASGINETGAFFVQTIYGEIDNVTLDGNFLKTGGGFNLALEVHGQSRDKYGRNMKANNNRFEYPANGYGASYVTRNGVVSYGWAETNNNYKYSLTAADNRGTALTLNNFTD